MNLVDLTGTKYPIIQGGMANIATGEFAAAVSNAGGLGLVASGGMNAEQLREQIVGLNMKVERLEKEVRENRQALKELHAKGVYPEKL